jgi:hypothetical protein
MNFVTDLFCACCLVFDWLNFDWLNFDWLNFGRKGKSRNRCFCVGKPSAVAAYGTERDRYI